VGVVLGDLACLKIRLNSIAESGLSLVGKVKSKVERSKGWENMQQPRN